jgi:hypothetical protein
MAMSFEWRVPQEVEPREGDYDYDLERALSAVVGISANVPPDAFTADVLGTERSGNGVIIRNDGLIVTIGYLITEAEEIWLTLADGRTVPGHAIGYDQETGFGLVQALARLDSPFLPLGDSGKTRTGTDVVAAGAGGVEHSVAARLIARQEFAGYWEYVLDEALFTAPAHPYWGWATIARALAPRIRRSPSPSKSISRKTWSCAASRRIPWSVPTPVGWRSANGCPRKSSLRSISYSGRCSAADYAATS